MKSNRRRLGFASVLCLMALGVLGCHHKADYVTVRGKVTFQGRPVAQGRVVFVEPHYRIFQTAKLRPDGSYRVDMGDGPGLPAGDYQVAILPPVVEPPGSKTFGPKTPLNPADIPPKYRDPATSKIAFAVKDGSNPSFDIDMKP